MKVPTPTLSGLAALLLWAMSLGLTTTAQANNIVVNSLADASVTGACTLRDAIAAAETDSPVNGCAAGSGADTIGFSVSGVITLASPSSSRCRQFRDFSGFGRE